MSNEVVMRTGRDRLRYTVAFEVLLLAMLIPAGAVFFEKPAASIGMLGIVLSSKAMVINLAYNWVFDKIDARAGRVSSQRSTAGRILHAFGFELTLLVTSLPILAWWLSITLLEAIAADLVVTTFVVAYTYVFTLAYDRLFPLECQPKFS